MNGAIAVPCAEVILERIGSENALLLDGLRRARVAEGRWAVSGQGDQRAVLIEGLDDGGEQFSGGRAAGGDDRAGEAGFHGSAEREKSGRAFLEVPPQANDAGGFRTGKGLDQGGVAGTGADHEFPDPGPEAAVHHIKRRFPCVHRAVLGQGIANVHCRGWTKKGRRGTHPGGQAEQLQNTPAV